MIDILIDDDNKVSIKTTNGIAETEIASAMVVEAMRNLFKPKSDSTARTSYYLYLKTVADNEKLAAVKTICQVSNCDLKTAKDITDAALDGQKTLIMQSYDYNVIRRLRGSLEELGCTCEVTSN